MKKKNGNIFSNIKKKILKGKNKFTIVEAISFMVVTFALGMIIGGIVGNLIDRLLYHSVIDYLSFNIFGYNFPVFNIADIGITVGCLLYIIELIRRSINESKSRSRKKDKNR